VKEAAPTLAVGCGRAPAAASPAATLRASVFACLRSDSSDGRAGRVRADEVFEAMATFFHVRLSPADIRLKEGAVCAL
jgi:hypothetical protein